VRAGGVLFSSHPFESLKLVGKGGNHTQGFLFLHVYFYFFWTFGQTRTSIFARK